MSEVPVTPETTTTSAPPGSNTAMVRWSSRKFWAMMVWESVFIWLFIEHKLPVEALTSVTWLLLGGYFAGNVAQHVFVPGAESK